MAPRNKIPQGRFFDSMSWNFVLLSGLGILAIVVVGIFMANLGQSFLLEAERQQLEETSSMVISSMEAAKPGSDLQALVISLKRDTRYRITIINQDGSVQADSNADPQGLDNHADRPEVRQALRGKAFFDIRYSKTLRQDMLYFARPLNHQVLRVSIPLFAVAALLRSYFAIVVSVLAGAAIIMILVSWRMYRGIIIPVTHILNAAQAWEDGGQTPIVTVSKPLELAGISHGLRHMADELNRRIAESSLREQELERLFEAIREPVLVIDHNQVVTSANTPALDFINQLEPDETGKPEAREKAVLGKHLLTFIRSSQLAQLINDSDSAAGARSQTIQLYGPVNRQFGAYVAPLTQSTPEGTRLFILVLYLELPFISRPEPDGCAADQ